MRVLLVLTQPPLPEGGAPGKTAIGLIRGLQGHGIDVRAIAARRSFSVTGEVPADLPVEVVDVEPPGAFGARLQRIRRPVGELAAEPFAGVVREAAREADVVHLEETETAWCDEGVATPSLVHVHYLARRDRSLGAPWRKQFREVLDLARAERAAVRRHRYLVASSPLVADELRTAAPKAEVVVAPLSLDPALYHSGAARRPANGRADRDRAVGAHGRGDALAARRTCGRGCRCPARGSCSRAAGPRGSASLPPRMWSSSERSSPRAISSTGSRCSCSRSSAGAG